MTPTKVLFTAPTTNTDGSAINEALTYVVSLDTANPPVTSYAVPAAAAPNANGVVTVAFSDLGFKPVNGATYFGDVQATDASGTSAVSNIATFTYTVVPNAPTGFTVG